MLQASTRWTPLETPTVLVRAIGTIEGTGTCLHVCQYGFCGGVDVDLFMSIYMPCYIRLHVVMGLMVYRAEVHSYLADHLYLLTFNQQFFGLCHQNPTNCTQQDICAPTCKGRTTMYSFAPSTEQRCTVMHVTLNPYTKAHKKTYSMEFMELMYPCLL